MFLMISMIGYVIIQITGKKEHDFEGVLENCP